MLDIDSQNLFSQLSKKVGAKKKKCNLNTQLESLPLVSSFVQFVNVRVISHVSLRDRVEITNVQGAEIDLVDTRPLVRRDKSSTIPMNISPRHFDTASHCLLV